MPKLKPKRPRPQEAPARPKVEPLTVSGTAARALLGIGRSLFWGMVRSGRLPHGRLGGRLVILRSDVEALARELARGG